MAGGLLQQAGGAGERRPQQQSLRPGFPCKDAQRRGEPDAEAIKAIEHLAKDSSPRDSAQPGEDVEWACLDIEHMSDSPKDQHVDQNVFDLVSKDRMYHIGALLRGTDREQVRLSRAVVGGGLVGQRQAAIVIDS